MLLRNGFAERNPLPNQTQPPITQSPMTNTPNPEQRSVEQQLADIRSQIGTLDTDWHRRHNLLLDELLVLTQRVDGLTESQRQTQVTVNQLAQMIGRILPAIEEMQTEVRGLQSENRRILDHLFGQQPG